VVAVPTPITMTRIGGFDSFGVGDPVVVTRYAPRIIWCGWSWRTTARLILYRVRWCWTNKTLRRTKDVEYKASGVASATSITIKGGDYAEDEHL
jgi:hypothetical protein